MNVRAYKYSAAFILPTLTAVSFMSNGWWSFLPVLFAFGLLPVAEYLAGANSRNIALAEEEMIRQDKVYDFLLYLTIPIQLFFSIWFLRLTSQTQLSLAELAGHTLSMGLMNGVFGVNIAHELGHRNTLHEKLLAKVLLSSTLFLHFYIEHNRGHHRNVATEADPATARKNESIYRFWFRTVTHSFLSAWNIVKKERLRKKQSVWHPTNEFLQYMLIQIIIIAVIAYYVPGISLLCFLISALIGWLLLETVNYVEHYGLLRKKLNESRYEDVQPVHSWNSDFILGRLVLFELTRHSDHHCKPEKPYQTLHSLEHSSQLPAGYPAMMLLSLFPPLWFQVMNKRLPAQAS